MEASNTGPHMQAPFIPSTVSTLQVSLERMMSCGFGACNTCNVETVDGMKGACMCGPVFDASKVVVF